MIEDEKWLCKQPTTEETMKLYRHQFSGMFHPYTCPDHSDKPLIIEFIQHHKFGEVMYLSCIEYIKKGNIKDWPMCEYKKFDLSQIFGGK